MAAKGKLKVFRTAIGFEDAYVAAPSRKAALQAWGTAKDLFARGAAEVVTDPALTAAALAQPGQVVRVRRGSLAQHLAAATPVGQRKLKPAVKSGAAKSPPPEPKPKPAPKPKPRPSRAALDRAEAAVEAAASRHERERRALEDELEALRARQDRLVERHDAALAKLEAKRDAAAARYRDALAEWSDS